MPPWATEAGAEVAPETVRKTAVVKIERVLMISLSSFAAGYSNGSMKSFSHFQPSFKSEDLFGKINMAKFIGAILLVFF